MFDFQLARRMAGQPFSNSDFVGTLGPDLLFLFGGIILIGLGYTLHRIMMARK
jgi:hypothetical protein